jgi:hypothetical protein
VTDRQIVVLTLAALAFGGCVYVLLLAVFGRRK